MKMSYLFNKRKSNKNSGDTLSPVTSSRDSQPIRESDKSSQRQNTLADFVCYHHKKGTSVAEICEMTDRDEEYITAIIEEAKELGVYEKLASRIKQ